MKINNDTSFELKGKWRVFGGISTNSSTGNRNEQSTLNDKEFPGTLTYDADKRELVLDITAYDECSAILHKYFGLLKIIPIIEGHTTEGYVYLFHCFAVTYEAPNFTESISIESTSLCVNSLLIGKNPLVSTNEETSWKNLKFKEAEVEYKNLRYWAGGFQLKTTEEGFVDDILKMELNTKPINEKIEGTTITHHHDVVNKGWNHFKHGIFGYRDISTRAFIHFDLPGGEMKLEKIHNQITFMNALLHFAMLPHLSTYIVSVSVTDEKEHEYQFLWPSSIPQGARNEGKKLYHDCFIPCIWPINKGEDAAYFGLKKIAECFEKYKDDDDVNLLFHVFTHPSYTTNLGDQYMDIYRSMECAYRIIEKKSAKSGKYEQTEMVKFFIDNIHEEIKKRIEEDKSLGEQLKNEGKFIEDVCNIRHNYAHTKPSIFQEDALDKQEKMHIMSKCLTYQMLKKIFKLKENKVINCQIIDNLNSRWFRHSYPV